MLIKSIDFPSYFEDITDIENDNIDVFVELENDEDYTIHCNCSNSEKYGIFNR